MAANPTESTNPTSTEPTLCSMCQTFFGRPDTNDMCSVCYGKWIKSAGADAKASGTGPVSGKVSAELASATGKDTTDNKDNGTISVLKIDSAGNKLDVPSPSGGSVSSDDASSAAATEGGTPVQKNKGRCFECRAKVPLVSQTTNKCKCGYVFCDKHKAAERHACTYDYKTSGREELSSRNQKVVGQKLEKI
eukprot:Clim_evm62s157 gene=Clim_evmTU62s157